MTLPLTTGSLEPTAPHGVASGGASLTERSSTRRGAAEPSRSSTRVGSATPCVRVYVGTIVCRLRRTQPSTFTIPITIWLALTVVFANFAEAMAEGRGKAQAAALRKLRSETAARQLLDDGVEVSVAASELARGDRVVCEAGDVIPSDGEIVEGIASVDESAITGESAPVIRESGGDRSGVTGGTSVLSDRIVVEITAERGETFLDRMITLVEGANRQRTPNEIALTILLVGPHHRLPPGGASRSSRSARSRGRAPSASWCSSRSSSA